MHRSLQTFLPLPLIGVHALLAACVSSSYSGQQYAPTQQVEVLHDQGSIPAGYFSMGEIRTTASPGMSLQSIEAELVDQARRRGADAILVERVELQTIGHQVEPSPANPEGVVAAGGGTAGSGKAIREQVVTARLLKRSGGS